MNPILSQSPLTYILAQVKIGPILALEKHINDVQEAIRGDFPQYNEIQSHEILLRPEGEPTLRGFTQWHFSNIESTMGILLQKDAITLHTTDYKSFKVLSNILAQMVSNINPILNIGTYTRVGLRYINLIQNAIEESLLKELLGFHLELDDMIFNKKGFFSKTEAVQDTNVGLIRIQTIHTQIQKLQQAENVFVPSDLLPVADLLSFKKYYKPKDSFAILDIDHFTKASPEKFDKEKIINELELLHQGIYKAFTKAVTSEALALWR
jgi:uncharacterized protein (TIGR04255 family)